jgi:ribosomal protein S18 acetylase RimI-like enzyme
MMFRLGFRAETVADDTFVRALYASTRNAEMSLINWDATTQTAFIQQQFDLQRLHYHQHYPLADFRLILLNEQPIGRWYLNSSVETFHLIDITLLPEQRKQGFGSYLLNQLQREASQQGKSITLQVESHNPALQWYRRLGFTVQNEQGIYLRMQWLSN